MATLKFTAIKGEVINAAGEVIAKVTDGTLDVRRPAKLESPKNVEADPRSVGETFAQWYHEQGCCSSEVSEQDMEERFGIVPTLPAIPKNNQIFGMIEHSEKFSYEDGDETEKFYCIVCNGKFVRVGLVREKSVQWAYPNKLEESRNTVSSTRAVEAEEVFHIVCGSFTGDFRKKSDSNQKKANKTLPKKVSKPTAEAPAVKRKLPKRKQGE